MMFQKVSRDEFYLHVSRVTQHAARVGHIYNKRQVHSGTTMRIIREINGVPFAERKRENGHAKFYILK